MPITIIIISKKYPNTSTSNIITILQHKLNCGLGCNKGCISFYNCLYTWNFSILLQICFIKEHNTQKMPFVLFFTFVSIRMISKVFASSSAFDTALKQSFVQIQCARLCINKIFLFIFNFHKLRQELFTLSVDVPTYFIIITQQNKLTSKDILIFIFRYFQSQCFWELF